MNILNIATLGTLLLVSPVLAADKALLYTGKKSGWTPKAALNAGVLEFLPQRGVLLMSGGLLSPARRAAVELHAGTSISEIRYALGEGPSAPKDDEAMRLLSDGEAARMTNLVNRVSVSTSSDREWEDDNHFAVSVTLADGDEVKHVVLYGRPTGEMEALYSYVWTLIEEGQPALKLAVAEAKKNSKRYGRFMARKEKLSTSVYPGSKPDLWSVKFSPQMTDQDIDCQVDVKKKTAKCVEHFE